jgi:hypothetical protein
VQDILNFMRINAPIKNSEEKAPDDHGEAQLNVFSIIDILCWIIDSSIIRSVQKEIKRERSGSTRQYRYHSFAPNFRLQQM